MIASDERIDQKWKRVRTALSYSSRELLNCHLCERHCGVNRRRNELGLCGVGAESRYYSALVNYGEEPFLSPSYCVYFTGCEMRCVFCSAHEWVARPTLGEAVDLEALAAGIGPEARSISFIGGNPSVNLHDILRLIDLARPTIPLCWNSNFYETPETLQTLFGIIDVFQADYKFGNQACANRLSRTPGYCGTVERNLRLARDHADLVIRHLLMPGHVECCLKPICRWVGEHCPDSVFFLMTGYVPWGPAAGSGSFGDLRRRPTDDEISRAEELCDRHGLRWMKSA